MSDYIVERSAGTLIEIKQRGLDLIDAWSIPMTPFEYVDETRWDARWDCGCLSIIRATHTKGAIAMDGSMDDALTNAIRADERLQKWSIQMLEDGEDFTITVEHIPLFAAWQSNIEEYWNGDRTADNVVPTDEEVEAMGNAIAEKVKEMNKWTDQQ